MTTASSYGITQLLSDWSRIVEMRFFAGLSAKEIAGVLNVSHRTVEREWNRARAWLYRELRGKDES
jgi:RNA polymerase sigma-70 factor, ECF subfamily